MGVVVESNTNVYFSLSIVSYSVGSEALHGGEGGERSVLSSSVIESEFLIDMFGSDFYSSEDTAHIQHERLEVYTLRLVLFVGILRIK